MNIPFTANTWVEIKVECPNCGIIFKYEERFDPVTDSNYYECDNCNYIMLIESPLPPRDIDLSENSI